MPPDFWPYSLRLGFSGSVSEWFRFSPGELLASVTSQQEIRFEKNTEMNKEGVNIKKQSTIMSTKGIVHLG